MTDDERAGDQRLTAEQRARGLIDQQLTAAGWAVQARQQLNLFAAQGVACREVVMASGHGRSIYGLWRGVLEYFDARVVGLTATPGKQTFAFFRQSLVSEYTYPQSVADWVCVDFDLYRIRTEISERGAAIEAGTVVPKVDRRARAEQLETPRRRPGVHLPGPSWRPFGTGCSLRSSRPVDRAQDAELRPGRRPCRGGRHDGA